MRSVLRRPVLLLSAAATVTVPGALVVLAVLGHQSGESAVAASPASLGSSQEDQQAAMLPAEGSRTARDPDGEAMAPVIAVAENRVRGTRLLGQAAAAGRSASYQGVETITDTTVAGRSTAVATVWHRGGGLTVTRVAEGRSEETYDDAGRAPDAVFGVTATLVPLLERHYIPVYLGTGFVIGRPSLIVAVQRPDGSTAAQFWLDERTLLPLRRDVYDTSAHTVSDARFTRLRFGAEKMPRASAARGRAAWATSSPAQLLSTLNGEGCLLPATLPGNLSLYAASEAATSSGQVADLGFSDGLSVVSLFVERGALPAKMPGWRQASIAGHVVYMAQHEVTMSGRGFVYTMIADAPPQTVDAVVGALPSTGGPGILGRLGHGLGRLVSDLDPFG